MLSQLGAGPSSFFGAAFFSVSSLYFGLLLRVFATSFGFLIPRILIPMAGLLVRGFMIGFPFSSRSVGARAKPHPRQFSVRSEIASERNRARVALTPQEAIPGKTSLSKSIMNGEPNPLGAVRTFIMTPVTYSFPESAMSEPCKSGPPSFGPMVSLTLGICVSFSLFYFLGVTVRLAASRTNPHDSSRNIFSACFPLYPASVADVFRNFILAIHSAVAIQPMREILRYMDRAEVLAKDASIWEVLSMKARRNDLCPSCDESRNRA